MEDADFIMFLALTVVSAVCFVAFKYMAKSMDEEMKK